NQPLSKTAPRFPGGFCSRCSRTVSKLRKVQFTSPLGRNWPMGRPPPHDAERAGGDERLEKGIQEHGVASGRRIAISLPVLVFYQINNTLDLMVRLYSRVVLGIRSRPSHTSQAASPRVRGGVAAPPSTATTGRGSGR